MLGRVRFVSVLLVRGRRGGGGAVPLALEAGGFVGAAAAAEALRPVVLAPAVLAPVGPGAAAL